MADEINRKVKEARPRTDYYRPAIERLRLILMFFMCIALFGFPTVFGDYIKIFCGFVSIAFFILSGYLVLHETEDRPARILRSIKRTAVVFGVLAAVYFILNWIYYGSRGVNIFSAFVSPRFWFNFLVMNVWQFSIGSAIWYVQALLYAYIIIYFLNKWKLLRYDWLIAAVLILFTVCTGELAGVLRWNIMGYNCIPGNFLTRALPYVLLGGFIHKNMRFLNEVKKRWYWLGILGGIFLMFAEIVVLGALHVPGYYGHLLGMPVVAFSVCMLAFAGEMAPGFEQFLGMSRWHINCIYYLCQPVSLLLAFFLSGWSAETVASAVGYLGIFIFLICFILAWMISHIDRTYIHKSEEEEHE